MFPEVIVTKYIISKQKESTFFLIKNTIAFEHET